MFKLTIQTDNEAFADDSAGEISRILAELAAKLGPGMLAGQTGKLRDINGNTVGEWRLT